LKPELNFEMVALLELKQIKSTLPENFMENNREQEIGVIIGEGKQIQKLLNLCYVGLEPPHEVELMLFHPLKKASEQYRQYTNRLFEHLSDVAEQTTGRFPAEE